MSSTSKSSPPGGKKKQGTLFSFFSKKPMAKKPTPSKALPSASKPTAKSASKSTPVSSTPFPKPFQSNDSADGSNNPKSNSSSKESLLSQLKVGTAIAVYWPDDDEYYNAKISSRQRGQGGGNDHVYTLVYEDGEVETINLANEDFKILADSNTSGSSSEYQITTVMDAADSSIVSQGGDDSENNDDENDGPFRGNRRNTSSSKKRKIIEESDEEAEFDDDDNDMDEAEEEEFIADSQDEEDEEEEDFEMDDEDDEEVINNGKKSKSKQVAATTKTNPYSTSTSERCAKDTFCITPPPTKKKKDAVAVSTESSSSTNANDNSVVPTNAFAGLSSGKKKQTSGSGSGPFAKRNKAVREISPMTEDVGAGFQSPTKMKSKTTSSHPKTKTKIPMPLQGVVNQAGTHYHNHYTFLHEDKIRDGKNRRPSHPDYNPRTLSVDYNEINKYSKVTPAAKQWWELKSRYADTILLFKTGKFYEIFHMDADVAVQVLGFNYMKGQAAHAGFPEIGYGKFCERLVKAGYKVARVEQTETPDMLKERKKKAAVGKKPSVVNREVCSIVSAGTRTFCYMDDVSCFEGTSDGHQSGVGPLLSIKETLISSGGDSAQGDDSDNIQPVCEYGITIVNAVTGEITLGQFADDVLRSRMNTVLTKYRPSEILVENGPNGVSETLLSLIKSVKNSFLPLCRVEKISAKETFPKSNALDSKVRALMERPKTDVQPWDKKETMQELHRRGYFPRASRKKSQVDSSPEDGISRWPEVLKACIQGGAELAISSLGATLFYLQRNLIDQEILSMGIVKGYIPPDPMSNSSDSGKRIDNNSSNSDVLKDIVSEEARKEDGIETSTSATNSESNAAQSSVRFTSLEHSTDNESSIDHLSLDGTTIANLQVLANSHSHTEDSSLWSKINFTKSQFGSRLLRAWLLRPLFRKEDIDRRADAVEELTSGSVFAAMEEARDALARCGDMERLLSRVHSMSGGSSEGGMSHHPNERAILYETATHTKRKVGDFSKLLDGLKAISRIPEIFAGIEIKSPLLSRIVRTQEDGGLFPSNLAEELDWFIENFDCRKAAEGKFEPTQGIDENYDAACDEIDRIKASLDDYKTEMCEEVLRPNDVAMSQWKYANTKVDSKDKYLIELPVHVQVPRDFIVKGKRGKGQKQINKYRTPIVEELVVALEHAYDVMKEGRARGIQMIFTKFDSLRSIWTAASHASAMLDALGALAKASTTAGYCRPVIKECKHDDSPSIFVRQGRHPCVDITHSGDDFTPNDLALGGNTDSDSSRVLLLSGPNMGGKSTLLRQTCLIAILAQIGCFVPAEECTLTPFDRIFTRLGASDRILLGQSTFFVELAETATALRGATRRSLCIFDELGRGTSTFDGTAIASAAVKHLVEKNQCITLFATHYHSLLEDWKDQPSVRLGHMECFVEDETNESESTDDDQNNADPDITFLYTLGEGSCPKSFGINVARLAGLPSDVLKKAKEVSSSFEESLNNGNNNISMTGSEVVSLKSQLMAAVKEKNFTDIKRLWEQLQG